jgi:ribonuclease HI
MLMQVNTEAGCSNWDSDQQWKKLWQLKVVPKVRIFWWRAIKGFLPCYAELTRRHVKDEGTCKLCGYEDETLYHTLLQCVHAKQFWTATLDHFGFSIPRLHPATWMQDLMLGSFLKSDQVPIAITVLWCIWTSRNKYVHGEEPYRPMGSMQLVEEQITMLELPPKQVAPNKPVCRWIKPPLGWCMVNTDGALNCTTREGGSGYVIRNELGEFLEAGCRRHSFVEDPFISELLASREGLEAAARQGIPKVIIQTDSKNLVSLWQDESQPRFQGAHVVQEMKVLCENFQEVKFLYIGRDANKVAHRCAKEALSVVGSVRFDVMPGFLADVFQSDCNHYPVI